MAGARVERDHLTHVHLEFIRSVDQLGPQLLGGCNG
jgi:hypothetical protein